MPLFTTDGHLSDEGLSVYAETLNTDKLDSLDKSIARHIQSCLDCRSQAIDLYALIKTLDDDQAIRRPAVRTRLRWLRYTPWAAAAMLAGLVFYFYNPQAADVPDPIAGQSQELPVPVPPAEEKKAPAESREKPAESVEKDLLAIAFVPNDQLETFVGDVTRSGQITIKSPTIEKVFKPAETIKFEWEGAETGLEIVILNNVDELFSRDRVSGREFNREAPGIPGLYYWKLETEDDLLYVGKFLVK